MSPEPDAATGQVCAFPIFPPACIAGAAAWVAAFTQPHGRRRFIRLAVTLALALVGVEAAAGLAHEPASVSWPASSLQRSRPARCPPTRAASPSPTSSTAPASPCPMGDEMRADLGRTAPAMDA